MLRVLLGALLLTLTAAQAGAQTPTDSEPRWALSLGPWYGHNLKETDSGSSDKTSDLLGPELRLDYALSPA